MGKRSNFERRERDSYDTPYEAVIPLLEHLSESTAFIEPCAGKNELIGHLTQNGHKCLHASDIHPRQQTIAIQCVLDGPFRSDNRATHFWDAFFTKACRLQQRRMFSAQCRAKAA